MADKITTCKHCGIDISQDETVSSYLLDQGWVDCCENCGANLYGFCDGCGKSHPIEDISNYDYICRKHTAKFEEQVK